MATKHDYITIAPVTPKGKWTICSRRIGTEDRFAPIAEVRAEGTANTIVTALNRLQGDLKKLEVPAQKVLEEVREQITKERKIVDQLRRDLREKQDKVRELEYKISRLEREREVHSEKATA